MPKKQIHIPSPCLTWQFDLSVRGTGIAAECLSAYPLAYLDALKSADALAKVICAQPFGCSSRLIRVNRVDGTECVELDSGQHEVHLTAHITYGCG